MYVIDNLYLYQLMKQLANDVKTLILKNRKTILILSVVFFLVCFYPDIKQGFIDAWMNN